MCFRGRPIIHTRHVVRLLRVILSLPYGFPTSKDLDVSNRYRVYGTDHDSRTSATNRGLRETDVRRPNYGPRRRIINTFAMTYNVFSVHTCFFFLTRLVTFFIYLFFALVSWPRGSETNERTSVAKRFDCLTLVLPAVRYAGTTKIKLLYNTLS